MSRTDCFSHTCISSRQKQKTLLYVIPASFSFTLSKEGLRNMMNFWWFLMRSSGTGVTWKVGIRLNIDNGPVYLFYLPVNCIITKNNMVNSTGYRRSQKQVKRSRDSDKVSYTNKHFLCCTIIHYKSGEGMFCNLDWIASRVMYWESLGDINGYIPYTIYITCKKITTSLLKN